MRSSVLLFYVTVGVFVCLGGVGKHSVEARDVPYTVELKDFETRKDYDGSWLDWDTLRLKKVSRNRIGVSESVNLNRNLGNEQKISIIVFPYDSEHKQRGPVVFKLNKPICQYIEEDEDVYPDMVKKSNLPEKPDCPFPQGTYTFDNYEIDATFLPDDSPKGDYLVEVLFMDGERNVAGADVYVTLS